MSKVNTWPGWECVRTLGSGAFGTVYAIQKIENGKTYTAALKVISIPQNQADIEDAFSEGMDRKNVTEYFQSCVNNFTNEIALMSELKGYTNIVSYEDHMVIPHDDGIGWNILIRMELLTPLKKWAMEHPISEKDIIKLGNDICQALIICHKNKIIHRDIKPENIFVNKNGDFKLGDFGIARIVEQKTSVMSQKGTFPYMAPEVFKGQQYNETADIYSLGTVLYRFLNGNRTPFLPFGGLTASDRQKAFERRMSGEEIPEPQHGSEQLKRIILETLEYDPGKRFQSATLLKKALHQCEESASTSILIAPSVRRTGLETTETTESEVTVVKKQVISNKPEKKKKRILLLLVCMILFLGIGMFLLVSRGGNESEYLDQPDGNVAAITTLSPTKMPDRNLESISDRNPTPTQEEENIDITVSEGAELSGEWSEWTTDVPNFINAADYDIEEQTLYRSRRLETTSSTSADDMVGWELYDTANTVGEWGNWSDWSDAEVSASDTREVEKRTLCRYRELKTTESTQPQMEGWEQYNITYRNDGWGNWSSWEQVKASSKDNREFQTKTQYRQREIINNSGYSSWGNWSDWQDGSKSGDNLTEVQTRTVYPYYYFYCYHCGRNARFPFHGCICEVCGSTKVELSSGTVDWFENPWSSSTSWGSGKYYQYIDGGIWWNWGDGAPKNQYRYRARSVQNSISYGSWSDWSDSAYYSSSQWQVETRTLYRYREASETAVYHYRQWGSWSDWSSNILSETNKRQVQTTVKYRYRDKITGTTYYFRRWSEWSEYSAELVTPTDTVDVQTEVRYRYRRK